jgi:tetratricopeptide (TPR) repeat protein
MLPVALVLLMSAASPGPSGGSARPAECAKADGSSGTNVWERAKAPELAQYCEKLASATAQLVGTEPVSPEVLTLVDSAIQLRPQRAPGHALRGRALVRLARYPEAVAAFEAAKKRDDRALDEPRALFAFAHALARTGRLSDALVAFRTLLPRAARLEAAERGAAYVEAGLLLLRGGPSQLDDAIAVLREARRQAQDAVHSAALLGLALALERAGEHEQARALLAEPSKLPKRLESALAEPRAREVLAVGEPGIEHLLVGALLEEADPARAVAAYRAGLEKSAAGAASAPRPGGQPAKGPWDEHTRKRIDALSGRKAPR